MSAMSSRNEHLHSHLFLPAVQSLRPPFVPKIISIDKPLKAKRFADQPSCTRSNQAVLDLANLDGCRNGYSCTGPLHPALRQL
jgi:hypothetical protein